VYGVTKTAIVVGGASGIGWQTARQLLGAGWTVWIFDVRPTSADLQPTSELAQRLHYVRCDVCDPTSIEEAFANIAGALDALVYTAGVTRSGALESTTLEDARLMFDVNFLGAWLSIRAALPSLRINASTDEPARVVVVGSVGGIRLKAANGFYGATKAGLHALAQVFAVELAPSGVTVNAVAPGSTNTPMQAAAQALNVPGFKVSGPSPLGRIGEPEDVANAIVFLLGDEARYINGVVLPVDGGTRAAFISR
jgi:NAD(P)-dependent dehydrogenase (short-subunit alcohol dehydrogenase family)